MEFKGTRGKWNISSNSVDDSWVNISSDKGVIARTFYGDLEPIVTGNEAIANALLISKSLLLLENAQMHIDALDLSNMDFYVKYGFNVAELIPRTRQLIKETTTI